MPLEKLLQKAKQQWEDHQAEVDRVAKEKRAIEERERETTKNAFTATLYECVGDILNELNEDSSTVVIDRDEAFMWLCQYSLCCKLEIRHRVIRLGVYNDQCCQWLVHDSVSEDFAVYQRFIPPDRSINIFSIRKEYVLAKDLHEFLLLAILETQEEYDRLLPEFQAASAKLIQEQTTERLLAEYRRAIDEAVEKSDKEIADLNTVIKSWEWPEGCHLELFKITWCTAAVWQPILKEYAFDYEFGYSLSEFTDDRGYYRLLSQSEVHLGSHVKPGNRITIERLVVTSENGLPKELLEKATQQLELVKVYDCISEQSFRLLPQFLPKLPPEIADIFVIEPAIAIFDLDIPLMPCFEIRQALSLSFDIPDANDVGHPF